MVNTKSTHHSLAGKGLSHKTLRNHRIPTTESKSCSFPRPHNRDHPLNKSQKLIKILKIAPIFNTKLMSMAYITRLLSSVGVTRFGIWFRCALDDSSSLAHFLVGDVISNNRSSDVTAIAEANFNN